MSCLSLEQVYAYLEGELAASERRNFEAHLVRCPQCRRAVEDRRALLDAAASLPPFEVPDDFTAAIVARLGRVPRRVTVLSWAGAALAGLASFAATVVVATLLTGHSLSETFLVLNRFVWTNVRRLAFASAKAVKYLYLLGKILIEILGHILAWFKVATSFIGPEAQAAAVGAGVVILIAAGVLWRWKFLPERSHGN